MREIKFRAWLGKDYGMEYRVITGALGSFFAYIDPNDSASAVTTKYNTAQTPIMQFTGLKDKNGKEIYEGDIIKGVYENHLVEIGNFAAYLEGGVAGSFDIQGVFYKNEEGAPVPCERNCEVIGNIYEDGHLLEGQDSRGKI